MKQSEMRQLCIERDNAFIRAVTMDEWHSAYIYCQRWNVPIPTDERVFKGGILKACYNVNSIPKEVRELAAAKLRAWGWSPEVR